MIFVDYFQTSFNDNYLTGHTNLVSREKIKIMSKPAIISNNVWGKYVISAKVKSIFNRESKDFVIYKFMQCILNSSSMILLYSVER